MKTNITFWKKILNVLFVVRVSQTHSVVKPVIKTFVIIVYNNKNQLNVHSVDKICYDEVISNNCFAHHSM